MKYYQLSSALIGTAIVATQSQLVMALSPGNIKKIAEEITVKIINSNNSSEAASGIIIKGSKNSVNNTYTVLTSYHVVKDKKQYKIITFDKQNYQINNIKHLPNFDLAVVEFSSNQSYKIAKIGNSDQAESSTKVYVAGFPIESSSLSNPPLYLREGKVSANGTQQRDGYNFMYDMITYKGMSGGAILNEQGELVGIHGRGENQGIGTTINSVIPSMIAVGIDIKKTPPVLVATKPKADDFLIKANNNYSQKDFQGAIVNLTQAIHLNPSYSYAYIYRGNARSQLGDFQGAINDFNQAIKINPSYAPAYYNRGYIRQRIKDFQGARNDFNQAAIIINTGNINTGNNQVSVSIQSPSSQTQSQSQSSHSQIQSQSQSSYSQSQSQIQSSYSQSQSQIFQGGNGNFNQVMNVTPSDVQIYYNLGVVSIQLGDKQGAINDFKKVAESFQQQGNMEGYQEVVEIEGYQEVVEIIEDIEDNY